MTRPLADAAVGDHFALGEDAGLLVELLQLLPRLERAVGTHGLRPRHVARTGDVPRPLRRLRHPRGRDNVADVLRRGAHVHQRHLLAAQRALHFGPARAQAQVGTLRHRVLRRAYVGARGDEGPPLGRPLGASAVHQLRALVAVHLQQPEGERREPVVVVAVEHDRRLGRHAGLAHELGERLAVGNVAADAVVQLRLPVPPDGPADVPGVVCSRVHVDLD